MSIQEQPTSGRSAWVQPAMTLMSCSTSFHCDVSQLLKRVEVLMNERQKLGSEKGPPKWPEV